MNDHRGGVTHISGVIHPIYQTLVLPKERQMMTNITTSPKNGVSKQATIFYVLPKEAMSPDGNGAGEETKHLVLPKKTVSDARPDPKPRKNPHLWRAYQWWFTLVELRKRYTLRISSIERGKSSMDAIFEKEMIQQTGLAYLQENGTSVKKMEKAASKGTAIDILIEDTKKQMVTCGSMAGPVWNWVTSIKGFGEGGLAAQLIAQIDDIDECPTVASLWRFAGFAVIDGKAEKNQKGQTSKYNRKLKAICFNIADQFIKQQTPGYVDIYYAEKERQRTMYPEPLCLDCNAPAQSYQKRDNKTGLYVTGYRCPNKKKEHTVKYSNAHIHYRAWRKMIKAFLRDLWIEWKKCNVLPSKSVTN